MPDFNVDPERNYKRISNGDVVTGQQMLNILEVAGNATPEMVIFVLLDYMPTDEPATRPDSKYGTPE